ncbi:MAG: hypothetical protein IJ663_05680 [Spirochaetales bacterium]|nr:hypothetical protein [Spirochaetales bacterium]
MRRKVLIVSLFLLVLPAFLIAETELEYHEQVIAGYIGEYLDWGVTAFRYADSEGGKGLNLDINEVSNSIRYQIAPTQTPKSEPGLNIGSFHFFSSISNYSLRITPGYLVNTDDPSVRVPYELIVRFLGNFNNEDNELGYRFGILAACSGEYIDIVWDSVIGGAVMVENAGIYFRLSEEVTVPGLYSSTVVFELRTDT